MFWGCSEGIGSKAQEADTGEEDIDTAVRPGGLNTGLSH